MHYLKIFLQISHPSKSLSFQILCFTAFILPTQYGWSATQGHVGPTSQAASTITLRILPRNSDEAIKYGGTLFEHNAQGFEAVRAYCQAPQSLKTGNLTLSLPAKAMFVYTVSVATIPPSAQINGYSARDLLDIHCGFTVPPSFLSNSNSSATEPSTLIVEPI